MRAGSGEQLLTSTVMGFRQLVLDDAGARSPYVAAGASWHAGALRATCLRNAAHRAPAAGCRCGVHAWLRLDEALERREPHQVTVVVAARGRIVLGDHGMRAEQAEVVAVLTPRGARAPGRARRRFESRVARHLPGVGIVDSVAEARRDFPGDDLSSLGLHVATTPLRRHRPMWTLGWVVGVVALYAGLALLALSGSAAAWLRGDGWPLVLLALVGWQGWLLVVGGRASASD